MSFWCQKFSFDVQNIFGLSVILFSKVAITEANNRLAHEVKTSRSFSFRLTEKKKEVCTLHAPFKCILCIGNKDNRLLTLSLSDGFFLCKGASLSPSWAGDVSL